MRFDTFQEACQELRTQLMDHADIVHSKRWQGADIANNPNMATFELTHINFKIDLTEEDLRWYRSDIEPELPWADDHFEERVCRFPINPGEHWATWSHNSKSGAAAFLDNRGKFNHNYMERYWPKFAGLIASPTATKTEFRNKLKEYTENSGCPPPMNHGVMYPYGDLDDVIELLAQDAYTRQAYLPVWFPEDTGGGSKRAPCTLGYHFLMRNEKLDIVYHIRSCDFHKHFRNDLYLTVRLLLWVLGRLRSRDLRWASVTPGQFVMQIGSLHVFRSDWEKI